MGTQVTLDRVIPVLKEAILSQKPISLVQKDQTTETTEIDDALFVKIGDDVVEIETVSDYDVNGVKLSLKDIVFCWLHKDTPSSEYIQLVNSKNITNLTFGQRSRLVSTLTGSSTSSTASTKRTADQLDNAADVASATATKKPKSDPVYDKVKSHEREVANDYRGEDDFSYLIKLAQVKIVEQMKHKPSSKPRGTVSRSLSMTPQDRAKDPIIILSPLASSILNLSNISKFLQDSVFEPPTISSNNNGVVKIKKQTKFGPISFLLIDNTDKFFNKPDYWRRVVAIFTTGQNWQFKNYQISNPSELFRNYPGFYINHGEPVPKHVKDWGNVNVLSIDKTKRFRDRQIVESFWNVVERYMTYKGYGSRN